MGNWTDEHYKGHSGLCLFYKGTKMGSPPAEDSSGALMRCALPFSVYHFNRALTPSVSTSQRQMGLLMQWCGYVRPAIAASPVCLYRSTEREGEKGAENAKGSLWVCRCVRLRVSVSHYACTDTQTHIHTFQVLNWTVRDRCCGSGAINQEELTCCRRFDELLSLFNPSPPIPHTLGICQ